MRDGDSKANDMASLIEAFAHGSPQEWYTLRILSSRFLSCGDSSPSSIGWRNLKRSVSFIYLWRIYHWRRGFYTKLLKQTRLWEEPHVICPRGIPGKEWICETTKTHCICAQSISPVKKDQGQSVAMVVVLFELLVLLQWISFYAAEWDRTMND